MIRHLAAALDGFRGLEALAQSGPWLPWRNVDDLDPSCATLANQLARAEIIGPEGPLRHPAFCLGFLLMAPSSDYGAPIKTGKE
jgi:hypothetical protein